MPMQPRPIAETFRPWPSVRICMLAPRGVVSSAPFHLTASRHRPGDPDDRGTSINPHGLADAWRPRCDRSTRGEAVLATDGSVSGSVNDFAGCAPGAKCLQRLGEDVGSLGVGT